MTADLRDSERIRRQTTRPPFWRDVRVLRVLFQVVFVVLVFALLRYLFDNLITNLRRTGLPTGYQFLDFPAGFDIPGNPFRPSQPIGDAFRVGIGNTIRVSMVGIVLATILGVLVGIGRLSSNWLVRKTTGFYVQAVRNVPVLLVILFMSQAVLINLPPITRAAQVLNLAVLSNRGIYLPFGRGTGDLAPFGVVVVAALLIAGVVWYLRTRRFDETGEPHHRVLYAGTALVLIVVVGYFVLGQPIEFTAPTRDGRLVTGGINLPVTFSALLLGLVLYTATHIAEIVRGSIQAVPKGQTEAAQAIALTGFQRMRFVVLPQAMRIMIPPLASQYLNLTKNSSLAVAVGYFELTRVTFTVIGNGNPAPQSVSILMGSYLVMSLVISLVMNLINRRLELDSR
jgi:general L-amino acid transport system permease protein